MKIISSFFKFEFEYINIYSSILILTLLSKTLLEFDFDLSKLNFEYNNPIKINFRFLHPI